jgi:hypothetical protein
MNGLNSEKLLCTGNTCIILIPFAMANKNLDKMLDFIERFDLKKITGRKVKHRMVAIPKSMNIENSLVLKIIQVSNVPKLKIGIENTILRILQEFDQNGFD